MTARSTRRAEAPLKGLSPRERSRAVRKWFLRKVQRLERIAADPGPLPVKLPLLLSELAAWSDPANGFFAWTSPNIVAGRHPDLRARYDAVVAALRHRKAKVPRARTSHLQSERKYWETEAHALAQQVHRLLDEKHVLERSLAKAEVARRSIAAELELLQRSGHEGKAIPVLVDVSKPRPRED